MKQINFRIEEEDKDIFDEYNIQILAKTENNNAWVALPYMSKEQLINLKEILDNYIKNKL